MNKRKLLLTTLSLFALAGCGKTNSSSSSSNINDTSEEVQSLVSSLKSDDTNSESISSISSAKPIEKVEYIVVSPEAKRNPDAAGTVEDPMHLVDAIEASTKGTAIVLLDGTYKFSYNIMINPDTEKQTPTNEDESKTLIALHPLKAVFDFSSMSFNSSNRGISVNSNYWRVYGLEVFGAGDNGIYVGGNHNIIENCIVHDNGDTGLQLGRASSSQETIDTWPSYNLIKNCTSYDNHDPLGEDSDGFACKLTTGVGNVFDGCIAYNNVDDGWDLYTKGDTGPIGPVTLRNCVAFNNGVTSGKNTDGKPYGTPNSDGNGFKLGGEVISVQHEVYNCVAYNNLACGFTDNSNPGTIRMENCTAYNNGARDNDANNFDMCRDIDTSNNYYKNLLSYSDINYAFNLKYDKHFNSKDQYKGTAVDSIFYYGRTMLKFDGINECSYRDSKLRGTFINDESCPFVSTIAPDYLGDIHSLMRDEDYNVKLGDFLKVKEKFVTDNFAKSIVLGADLD